MGVFSHHAGRSSLEPGTLVDVKPLRWSFILSLPAFAAAIWLVFVVLAAVERRERNAELNVLICQGSVEEATAAVRRLAYLSDPPLDLAVAAAASPSGTVGQEAQLVINDLLRRWQRHLAAGRHVRRIAGQLSQLAAALDARRETFAMNDYEWLGNTAAKIVRVANQTSADRAPGLAVHCESLLALANTRLASAARPVSLKSADFGQPSGVAADGTAATSATTVVRPNADSAGASLPPATLTPPSQLALQGIVTVDDSESGVDESRGPLETPPPPTLNDVGHNQWVSPPLSTASVVPPIPQVANRQPSPLEFTSPPAIPTGSLRDDPAWAEPVEYVATRALLQRWLSANAEEARSIELELAQRGFTALPPELVKQLFTVVVDDRVQLVQDAIITPGVDARPWLLLLADDESGDVRLAAVTVMATSRDPELVETAWQVALHDSDPRLAALAERIRMRRASIDRR